MDFELQSWMQGKHMSKEQHKSFVGFLNRQHKFSDRHSTRERKCTPKRKEAQLDKPSVCPFIPPDRIGWKNNIVVKVKLNSGIVLYHLIIGIVFSSVF